MFTHQWSVKSTLCLSLCTFQVPSEHLCHLLISQSKHASAVWLAWVAAERWRGNEHFPTENTLSKICHEKVHTHSIVRTLSRMYVDDVPTENPTERCGDDIFPFRLEPMAVAQTAGAIYHKIITISSTSAIEAPTDIQPTFSSIAVALHFTSFKLSWGVRVFRVYENQNTCWHRSIGVGGWNLPRRARK